MAALTPLEQRKGHDMANDPGDLRGLSEAATTAVIAQASSGQLRAALAEYLLDELTDAARGRARGDRRPDIYGRRPSERFDDARLALLTMATRFDVLPANLDRAAADVRRQIAARILTTVDPGLPQVSAAGEAPTRHPPALAQEFNRPGLPAGTGVAPTAAIRPGQPPQPTTAARRAR